MIKLDRKRKDITPPPILVDDGGKGKEETERARKYFTSRKKMTEKFKYEAYRDEVVKNALKLLSYEKCAYCESKEAGSDYDIEHFRPKGRVTGPEVAKDQKGYYWLAADWDNLFLSCQHCNQSRMQVFMDGKKKNSGKKNHFPLADEKKRIATWRKWDTLKEQEEAVRLLLNPEKDDPKEHIVFKEVEEILPGTNIKRIIPMVDAVVKDNIVNRKGDISIQIYGLNRKQLVEVRVIHYNSIKDRIQLVDTLIKNYNEDADILPEERKKKRKEEITEKLTELKRLSEDNEQPYAAMIQHFINSYLEKVKTS